MGKRCQSPSSINTYKQCPRKYFYQYILKLKTTGSIHTVRGNVVHSVLEDFFDIPVNGLTKQNFKPFLHQHSQRLLVHHWRNADEKFKKLNLDQEELTHFFEESNLMMINWVDKFSAKLLNHQSADFAKSFQALTPIREKHYRDEDYFVQGYIDAIEKHGDTVRLMDYKTSKRFHMSEPYKLQLAIYSLLYGQEHGKAPDQAGIYFLKDTQQCEHIIPVDEEMIERAKSEIEVIHMNTVSENIDEYPKHESPLCKWRTGQCDFYEVCFGQKQISDFGPNVKLPTGVNLQ